MLERTSRWWRQPAGGREVLIVALPMVISSLSWTVMTFVDRMFLKWVSPEAMAASFSASIIWFSLTSLPLGVCAYTNSFVSQYNGDQQPREIGPIVWQAIWIAVILTPILLLANPLAPFLFDLADHDKGIRVDEVRYFQALNWGAGGMLVSQAAQTFYSGRGKTLMVMIVDSLFAALNVGLDYVWIFGYWGFPEAGAAGAGYATAVAMWLKALTYLLLLIRKKNRENFNTGSFRFDLKRWLRLWRFGGPSGLQMVLDVIGFTSFVIFVGRLGPIQSAATTMAFSVSTLAFMPIWGLGMAAGILVGQHLGENNPKLAGRASWNSLGIGMFYMAAISLLYILVPQVFLSGFVASDSAKGSNDEIARLATTLLQFVAAYNLFDASLTILVSAIKGAGDTQFVLWVSLIMAAVLGLLSWIAVEKIHAGLFGCWILIVGWVWVLGTVYFLRFLQGKWKTMRVIEMKHTEPVHSAE
ncbi:MAG: MATE family efflux transporter [Pirellulales bacterium]